MKKRTSLVLSLLAFLLLPALALAQPPGAMVVALDDVTFDDTPVQVWRTEAGRLVTARDLAGTATLRCVEGNCAWLDGIEIGLRQDVIARLHIDHTSAGFKAEGLTRGTLLSRRGAELATFRGTLRVTGLPTSGGFDVEIEQACAMSSYLNDRIRELNKFRTTVNGSLVRGADGWMLVDLQGSGVAWGDGSG